MNSSDNSARLPRGFAAARLQPLANFHSRLRGEEIRIILNSSTSGSLKLWSTTNRPYGPTFVTNLRSQPRSDRVEVLSRVSPKDIYIILKLQSRTWGFGPGWQHCLRRVSRRFSRSIASTSRSWIRWRSGWTASSAISTLFVHKSTHGAPGSSRTNRRNLSYIERSSKVI